MTILTFLTGVQLPNTMADLNEQLQGLQNQLNGHFNDKQSSDTTRKAETINPSDNPEADKVSKEEEEDADHISETSLSSSSSCRSSSSGEELSSDLYYIQSEDIPEGAQFVVIPHATAV